MQVKGFIIERHAANHESLEFVSNTVTGGFTSNVNDAELFLSIARAEEEITDLKQFFVNYDYNVKEVKRTAAWVVVQTVDYHGQPPVFWGGYRLGCVGDVSRAAVYNSAEQAAFVARKKNLKERAGWVAEKVDV